MTVTVVIPCFNAAAHVRRAVTSALNQESVSVEVIVVDDGSVDDTLSVLDRFSARIRVEECVHRGVSAARNRGTELASGSFIQYLDADDVLLPGAVARRVSALKERSGDVAYSDWERVEEDSGGVAMAREKVTAVIENVDPDPEIAVFTRFWAPPAALLYRRETVDRIGGWNESLPVIQDARFLLDAAMCGARFVHVPGIGAEYRVRRGEGLSRASAERFVRDVYANALQVEAAWRARNAFTDERQKAVYDVLDYTARTLFACDYPLFRENVHRLYELEPEFRLSWPKAAALLGRIVGWRLASGVLSAIGKPPPDVVARGR